MESNAVQIDNQPISATFYNEGHWLTDFVTPEQPDILLLWNNITKGLSSKADKAVAAWDWVAKQVKYKPFIKATIQVEGITSSQADFWQTPSMCARTHVGNCIAQGTKVLVIKDGQYQIKKIEEISDYQNYQVLSYNFQTGKVEPKPISGWFSNGVREVVSVRYNNGEITRTTPDHRFFHHGAEITIQEALSGQADIHNVRVVPPLSLGNVNRYKYCPEHLWLVGMYLAEGYTGGSHTVICNDNTEILAKIEASLTTLGIPYSRTQKEHSNYVRLLNKPAHVGFRGKKMDLEHLGHTAGKKHLTPDFLSLSRPRLIQLMQGYCDGDGYLPCRNRRKRLFASKHMGNYHYKKSFILQYGTASEELSDQLKLIHLILGRPLWYYYEPSSHGAGANPLPRHLMIEYKKPSYGRVNDFRDLGHLKIKETIDVTHMPVYDLTVADNHNFMLSNGALVHNCANKAFLLASLLRNGFPENQVHCVLGNLYNGHASGHAWVELAMDGQEYILESTRDDVPLIPVSKADRYEPVHYLNDKVVLAVPNRTVLTPFMACYSNWLRDYLHWSYINGGR